MVFLWILEVPSVGLQPPRRGTPIGCPLGLQFLGMRHSNGAFVFWLVVFFVGFLRCFVDFAFCWSGCLLVFLGVSCFFLCFKSYVWWSWAVWGRWVKIILFQI